MPSATDGQAPRCLLVAHTFPPVLGGSAGSMPRWHAMPAARSRCSPPAAITAPGRRCRAGGGRCRAAIPVARIGLVRPPLAEAAPRGRLARNIAWGQGVAVLAAAVAREARRHRADAICVCDDETVGCWSLSPLRAATPRPGLLPRRRPGAAGCDRHRAAGGGSMLPMRSSPRQLRAERLREAYGVPAAKLAVIPNGVDAGSLPARPSRPGAARAPRHRDGPARDPGGDAARAAQGRGSADRGAARNRARHPRALLVVAARARSGRRWSTWPSRRVARRRCASSARSRARRCRRCIAWPRSLALPNRAEPGESDGLPLVFLEAGPLAIRWSAAAPAARRGRRGWPQRLLVPGEDSGAIAAAILSTWMTAGGPQALSAAG